MHNALKRRIIESGNGSNQSKRSTTPMPNAQRRTPDSPSIHPKPLPTRYPFQNCPRHNERGSPMSVLTTARAGAKMVFNHPELVRWYFKNKIRVAGLFREQNTMDGFSKFPIGITLKPTFSCNLRCKMCSFVANGAVFENPKNSLPLDVWKRVVDDVRPYKPYMGFTGGDPTLSPYFTELVHYIKHQAM